jgi:Uma2 family endonuclease
MTPKPDSVMPRRATYDDYRQFPDDGKRYELIDGEIFMTPAPSPRHQFASKRLQRILERYFEDSGRLLVFAAPLDVILSDADVVQPDLVVVDRAQLSDRGVEGVPLVLVEILSPSRPAHDRLAKAARYAACGVQHFWIVDPDARTVDCFELRDRAYRLRGSAGGREALDVPAFTGLTLSLDGLWLDA